MRKIFLRRSKTSNPFIPYSIESDSGEDFVSKSELGDVCILFPKDGKYVFGLNSDKKGHSINSLLGIVDSQEELTESVYKKSVEYGKTLAYSLPEEFEFIDETNGPLKIKVHM